MNFPEQQNVEGKLSKRVKEEEEEERSGQHTRNTVGCKRNKSRAWTEGNGRGKNTTEMVRAET